MTGRAFLDDADVQDGKVVATTVNRPTESAFQDHVLKSSLSTFFVQVPWSVSS